MCSPGSGSKSDTELAAKARLHILGYEAAKRELERRGYTVINHNYSLYAGEQIEIYQTRKEHI